MFIKLYGVRTDIDTTKLPNSPPTADPNARLYPHSVELQKANLESQGSPNASSSNSTSTNAATSSLASAIPLAQLLTKPGALNALSSLSALGGLTELLGAQTGAAAAPVQTTGVHRSHKSSSSYGRSNEGHKLKNERNKYNPY